MRAWNVRVTVKLSDSLATTFHKSVVAINQDQAMDQALIAMGGLSYQDVDWITVQPNDKEVQLCGVSGKH